MNKRTMSTAIYFRILGYLTTLAIHGGNSFIMLTSLQDENVMKDPEIRTLKSMQSRYLTVWNVAFQLMYASFGLTCDLLTLMNTDNKLPKAIQNLRVSVFSSVVYPYGTGIFLLFWPFFIYDRGLIFPEFIDKVFSFNSNLVIHLAILPIVIWESAFLSKFEPKRHGRNLKITTGIYLIYTLYIHLTYFQIGIWPYPMMGLFWGSIFFPLLLVYCYIVLLLTYYSQWPLNKLFWGTHQIRKINKIN